MACVFKFGVYLTFFLQCLVNALHCIDRWSAASCLNNINNCLIRPIISQTMIQNCQKTCGMCNDNKLFLSQVWGYEQDAGSYNEFWHPPFGAVDGVNYTKAVAVNFPSGRNSPLQHCFVSSDSAKGQGRDNFRWLCLQLNETTFVDHVTLSLREAEQENNEGTRIRERRKNLRVYQSDLENCSTPEARQRMVTPANLCAEKLANQDVVWTARCKTPRQTRFIMLYAPEGMDVCEVYIQGDRVQCSAEYFDNGQECRPCTERCSSGTFCKPIQTCSSCDVYAVRGNRCNVTCPILCRRGQCDRTSQVCFQCNLGTYGSQCDESCPQCLDGCDQTTGLCVGGLCSGRKWNKTANCQADCSQRCRGFCYDDTGHCHLCSPNTFYGPFCNLPCPSHCLYGACEGNGHCFSCIAGFYGYFCNMTCNCTIGCTRDTGKCYTLCDQYSRCTTCPVHCRNRTCDTSGICLQGCNLGFLGTTCNISCAEVCAGGDCSSPLITGCVAGCARGYYGVLCTLSCPPACKDGCTGNPVSYSCHGCQPGKTGQRCEGSCPTTCQTCDQENADNCSQCVDGYYGNTCSELCSSGCSTWACEKDGTCKDCRPERWGRDCSNLCQHCLQKVCDRHSGECIGGCEIGSYGSNCSEVCNDNCLQRDCLPDGTCRLGCDGDQTGSMCDHLPANIISRYWFIVLVYLAIGSTVYATLAFRFHLRRSRDKKRWNEVSRDYRLQGQRSRIETTSKSVVKPSKSKSRQRIKSIWKSKSKRILSRKSVVDTVSGSKSGKLTSSASRISRLGASSV